LFSLYHNILNTCNDVAVCWYYDQLANLEEGEI